MATLPLPLTQIQAGAWAVIYCPRTQTFLFGKRSSAVNKGGAWNFFGGRVDAEEAPRAALVRELLEEAAIQVEESDLQELACIAGVKNGFRGDGPSLRNMHYYLLCLDASFVPTLNFEHSDYHWYAPDALPRRFNRPTILAIRAGILQQARAQAGIR